MWHFDTTQLLAPLCGIMALVLGAIEQFRKEA